MFYIKLTGLFILLFVTVTGVILLRYWNQLFGIDPSIPSETSGARSYGKAQALLVLILAAKLGLVMALHSG